jgi:hypothetical protein
LRVYRAKFCHWSICEHSRPITTAGDRDTVNVASTGLKQPARICAFFWNLAASADSIRAREYDSPIVCPSFGNRACELRRRARTLTYRWSSPQTLQMISHSLTLAQPILKISNTNAPGVDCVAQHFDQWQYHPPAARDGLTWATRSPTPKAK